MAVIINDGGGGDGDELSNLGGEGGLLSEAVTGTTSDASPGVRRAEERLSGGEVLVRGRGRRGLTLYYARLGRGGCTLSVAEAEAKGEVVANSEEVK